MGPRVFTINGIFINIIAFAYHSTQVRNSRLTSIFTTILTILSCIIFRTLGVVTARTILIIGEEYFLFDHSSVALPAVSLYIGKIGKLLV